MELRADGLTVRSGVTNAEVEQTDGEARFFLPYPEERVAGGAALLKELSFLLGESNAVMV